MGVFDDLKKSIPKKIVGQIWLNILLEYDVGGTAKVIKSYTRPAKESDIKKATVNKSVKKAYVPKKVSDVKTVGLFD